MTPPHDRSLPPDRPWPIGAEVLVRSRFQGDWCAGFTVDEHHPDSTYTVRRKSDGMCLPTRFAPEDLNAA